MKILMFIFSLNAFAGVISGGGTSYEKFLEPPSQIDVQNPITTTSPKSTHPDQEEDH